MNYRLAVFIVGFVVIGISAWRGCSPAVADDVQYSRWVRAEEKQAAALESIASTLKNIERKMD